MKTYFEEYNRNVGRIKSINKNELVINVNAGRGGKDSTIPISSCINFDPKVDDRILLCINDDGDQVLQKLKKGRQN